MSDTPFWDKYQVVSLKTLKPVPLERALPDLLRNDLNRFGFARRDGNEIDSSGESEIKKELRKLLKTKAKV